MRRSLLPCATCLVVGCMENGTVTGEAAVEGTLQAGTKDVCVIVQVDHVGFSGVGDAATLSALELPEKAQLIFVESASSEVLGGAVLGGSDAPDSADLELVFPFLEHADDPFAFSIWLHVEPSPSADRPFAFELEIVTRWREKERPSEPVVDIAVEVVRCPS